MGSKNRSVLRTFSPIRKSFKCILLYTIFDKRRCGLFTSLGGLFVTFLIIEALMVFVTLSILWMEELPVKLVMQHYEPLKYRGLNQRIPSNKLEAVSIYHVTKEYDAAAMGGLGQIVTGLSHAQANAGLKVNIVMPHYLYLNLKYKKRLEQWSNGEITYKGWHGQSIPIPYTVHRLQLNVTGTKISFPKQPTARQMLTVYLIGPSTTYPFDRAFQVDKITDIYASPPGLPQEWKDLYFCKAAADFIAYQSATSDTPLFQNAEAGDHAVDLVHVHGATNALTIEFMNIIEKNGGFSRGAPTIVYTLHDYLDELEYSNELKNINRFMDTEDVTERLVDKYLYGYRVYPSALGIDNSHVSTFVSRHMAKQLVEGQLDFRYKELVMPSIRAKARDGYFVGITNGVDLSNFNPFADRTLFTSKTIYPKNIITAKSIEDIPNNQRIITAKKAAKKFLIKHNLLSGADLNRPIVLFVGRFQNNKGIEFFPAAADIISKLNAKLIIMGQNSGYSRNILTAIKLKHPDHVTVIDDNEQQSAYGTIYRAAADIVFVPSLTESFGLVAVEGLLFGCPVVTSGVGGMKEFLVDKTRSPSNNTSYNSYVFNLSGEDVEAATDGMVKALKTAIQDNRKLKKNSNAHESFVRSLIKNAMRLGWHVKNGAERQYARAYYMAIKVARKKQFRDASIEW